LEEVLRPPDLLDPDDRGVLARELEEHLARLSPHAAVLDAARSLVERGACVVVTGQQPGLLAAPLYSLYKALQALRLARLLRERWGAPVVALFWNHADDHDIAEVHHAHVVNRNLDLQKVSLAGVSSGRLPFSRIVLQENTHHLGAIRALLAQTIEGAPFAERALEVFVPRAGETLAGAFTRSFTELLGRAGLIVLEPDWIRPQISVHLARLAASDPVRHLERAAERLRAQGLQPAIEPSGAALFYAHEREGRRALRAGGDGFRFDGESGSRTGVELAADILQAPLSWSPGALMRPLVQDLCLPVAAYVGGVGELAYHAELPELRASVGAPATPFVPRVSCTLVDPECRVSLARLGVDIERVLRAKGTFEPAGAGSESPAVIERMRSITASSAREIESLREELSALDPGLLSQLKRAADQVRSAGEWLADKAERVHQNKSGKGRRHVRRLQNSLCPHGELQERVLGPLPFVARFGEDWPLELLEAMDPFGAEHLVVHLGSDLEGDAA
jgi:bacillithiol biosynthesis cysteine-adding enzyme BshC